MLFKVKAYDFQRWIELHRKHNVLADPPLILFMKNVTLKPIDNTSDSVFVSVPDLRTNLSVELAVVMTSQDNSLTTNKRWKSRDFSINI